MKRKHNKPTFEEVDRGVCHLIDNDPDGDCKRKMEELYRKHGWDHPFGAFSPSSSPLTRVAFLQSLSRQAGHRFAESQYQIFKGFDRVVDQKRNELRKVKSEINWLEHVGRIEQVHSDLYESLRHGLSPGKTEIDCLNQLYSDNGWNYTFPAFSEVSSRDLRTAWLSSLGKDGLANLADQYNLFVKARNSRIRKEEEFINTIANRVDEMNSLPDSWILARKYVGLTKDQQANLHAMASLIQKDLFYQIGENYRNLVIQKGLEWGRTKPGEEVREVVDPCGPAIHLWVRDQCHVFFISDALMDSLENTEVQGDFSLTEVPWLMEGFAVVLPRPVLTRFSYTSGREVDKEVVGFILGLPKDEQIQHGTASLIKRFRWEDHEREAAMTGAVPGVPVITLICRDTYGNVVDANMLDGPTKSFVFAILFAAVNKPELVTRGRRVSTPPGKNAKRGEVPTWTPNYLGRDYVIPDRSGEGTTGQDGRRVRRKRKGHMKMQPYGPQRSLRKRIWVEAYWAGSLEL